MKDLEKNRINEFEKSFDCKIFIFLEIWNDLIDGDFLFFLFSFEIGRYFEYLGIYQESNFIVSYQEKNEYDIFVIVQLEDVRVILISLGFDDDSVGGEELVEKEIQVVNCYVVQDEFRVWELLNEFNKFLVIVDFKFENIYDYLGSLELVENESKLNLFCDN